MVGWSEGHGEASQNSSLTARLRRRLGLIHPSLNFAAPLEAQFRQWYALQSRTRVRGSILVVMLPLLFVTLAPGPFASLRRALFGSGQEQFVDLLRFGVVLPSTALLIFVTYTKLYDRYFRAVVQIVVPLHAACFVALEVLMRSQGYSLASYMILVVLGSYFVFGLLYEQALRTALLILVTYALGGSLAGVSGPQWHFDLIVMSLAMLMGAASCRIQQKIARESFLDRQLLSDSASRDGLTGIYNRRTFDQHIDKVWQQASRESTPLALLILDIDYFKNLNDRAGHQEGDRCLVKIAAVLAHVSRRPLDLAARYGGEEFAILLYDAGRGAAEEIARQLRSDIAALALKHPNSPIGRFVTVSIGAACVDPTVGRTHLGFIQLADEAMYAAKAAGRDRVIVMDAEYESLSTGTFRTSVT